MITGIGSNEGLRRSQSVSEAHDRQQQALSAAPCNPSEDRSHAKKIGALIKKAYIKPAVVDYNQLSLMQVALVE